MQFSIPRNRNVGGISYSLRGIDPDYRYLFVSKVQGFPCFLSNPIYYVYIGMQGHDTRDEAKYSSKDIRKRKLAISKIFDKLPTFISFWNATIWLTQEVNLFFPHKRSHFSIKKVKTGSNFSSECQPITMNDICDSSSKRLCGYSRYGHSVVSNRPFNLLYQFQQ